MKAFFIIFLQFMLIYPAFAQKPKVFVFLPSEIRARQMANLLELRFQKKIDVFVFPRYTEFRDSVRESQPDAILTLEPVAEHCSKIMKDVVIYEPLVLGAKNGKKDDLYVFLSEKPVEQEKIKEMTIGVVNLMGRRAMPSYLEKSLGVRPRIKTVSKIEDLLSLLQFQYVDAILVSESKLDYYRKRSELKLTTSSIDLSVGLPALYISEDNKKYKTFLLEIFTNLDQDTNRKLGVDTWLP